MAGAVVIWYGDWSGNTTSSSNPRAQSLITNFAGAIGNSPYFTINTTYVNASGISVSPDVTLNGQISLDSSGYSTALSDAGVQAVVQSAITSGSFSVDSNGVYFVLTSGDVSETSGFLTQYCGWHTCTTVGNTTVQYSFVGDPAANTSACSAQTTGPNGDVGNADAMVSVIAHELEESATDPQLNAWYDRRGYENADKCAWKFGTTSTATNGTKYNMTLSGTNYLVQQNWVNASGGFCSMSH